MSACELMFNYYSHRKQRVKLGNNVSDWQHVYKGSAQGSIMGPLSYNMFTNDMFMILDGDVEVYNYADDNSLISAGFNAKQTQQNLIRNVNKVMDWFEQNNMKINPEKFSYIVFGNDSDVGSIVIRDHVIEPVSNVKILGLHLDNKLKFDHHVSKICQKAGRQIQVLSRLSHVLTEANKMLLYDSFVKCYFNYCACIWHFCSKSNTFKLEKLQSKALRYIMLDFKSAYVGLLNKCKKKLKIICIRDILINL